MLYRFGEYHLDLHRYALRYAGQPLKIEPKVFDVLVYLLQHRDRVVSKDELLDNVWPKQFISEATLGSCILAVRKAVGDSGRNQRVIQTVYGRGYRFIAAVEEVPDQDSRQPESRRCPVCQHDNSQAATFCAACGSRLQQRCPHCRQDVPLPAAFCTACGHSVAAVSPPAAATGEMPPLSEALPAPPVQGGVEAEPTPVIVRGASAIAHPVFISYASLDKATADTVCQFLEERGIACWLAPRNIPPGTNWASAIIDAIAAAPAMVLLFSEHANTSEQVKNEVERGVHHRKPFITLKLRSVLPAKDLEYFISRQQWLDVSDAALDHGLTQLEGALRPFVTEVLQPPDAVLTPPGQGRWHAERKPVTMLCCTVATTAEGRTRFDLDALHSLLQALRALAHDVVRQYGGRLSPVMGDHLCIMFGVPVTQEDDARRAVRVALDLRRRISTHQERFGTAYPGGLTLRMGLHTGLVVVEGQQDDAETAPTVVGDVISLALALQEQAAPGQILCSDATARLAQGAVSLTAVGAVPLPGQSTPVQAYAVFESHSRRAAGGQRLGRILHPFVDREREMATLHALLAQAETGRGQVVGVVGEAGMGKSRLVAEFRHSLEQRRLTYLTGRCLSYGSMTPYLPVLELLRNNCGITEADRPEDITVKLHRSLQELDIEPEAWAPPLLHLLDVQEGTQAFIALSPEARKVRTLTALTQMCLQGSRQRPLLLEVEDLHWIDASSNEWLTALVEQMMGVPLLVLVTYRPGYRPAWIDKSYVHQVALQPLTSAESLQVVQAVLPTAVPTAPLVPHLLATAEGNPFFLEELAQTVVEQGAEASVPTVPETVQAVLLARIDRLPASAKRLLQAAAVIGKDVAVPLLQTITDVPDEAMSRDLQHLQAAEFLYAAHTQTTLVYTFKHVLTQEVSYHALLRTTRQQYHARIAQGLEARLPEVAETQPELLAQHYTAAGQGGQAIPYWQRAGQRAVERSANVEAISHFTKGLELLKALPAGPEHIQQELALQLAMCTPLLMIKGDTASEVEHAYTRAYELAQQLGETPQRFSVLIGLWQFYFSQARFQRARELAEQCFTMAQHLQDVHLLQQVHLALGSTLLHLGEHVSAWASLEQGIALSDPEQSRTRAFSLGPDPGVVCLCRGAWILWMLGYAEQAVVRSQEALTRAQNMSHPYSLVWAHHFAGLLHQCRRDVQLVQAQAEAEIALASAHGFVEWLEGGMMLRGWALAQQGAMEEGIAQLRQGLDSWLARGTDVGKTQILARLAEAYRQAGYIAEGLRVLEEALVAVHSNGERHYEAEIYRLKGELLLQSGGRSLMPEGGQPQVSEAEACLYQALVVARRQQTKSLELRAVISLARLWQTQGKRVEACEMLTEIYGWFTEGFDTSDLQEARVLLAALQ